MVVNGEERFINPAMQTISLIRAQRGDREVLHDPVYIRDVFIVDHILIAARACDDRQILRQHPWVGRRYVLVKWNCRSPAVDNGLGALLKQVG
jgi:hypothetical protein